MYEVDFYTGEELKTYSNHMLIDIQEERDFVKAVNQYIISKENRVLAIAGLRGTGKTVGILQAIRNLNDYDNSGYLIINQDSGISCSELRDMIEKKFNSIKYIFIDEVTRVKDLCRASAFLYDRLCMLGKKVIISGTDSLAVVKSEESALYHRVIIKNITHIKYSEAKRTANQTLMEYVEMGGLYKADTVKDIEGLRKYIDTAVVDNIINTFSRNKDITSMLQIQNIQIEKLRVIVFKIIYAIIYLSTQKERQVNVKRIVDLFDYSNSELHDSKSLNELVCSQMGLDTRIVLEKNEVNLILEAMREIGLLIKIPNIAKITEYQYYLTNPSVVNQILFAMTEILKSEDLPVKKKAGINGFQGFIFESIIVCHAKEITDKYGYNIYFYHDEKQREIDLVVEKENLDEFGENSKYLLYEIKMTSDKEIAVLKSNWIMDKNVLEYITENGEMVKSAILYNGKTTVFEGFTRTDLRPTQQKTLKEIEEQNKGIELVNAEEFLLHLDRHIMNVLEQCEE